ncbi:MAG: hypothetical protein IPL78_23210 [Chloroflexi bacterium]|nr:hypothetical protein [Chloroflexota bacterium]
MNGSGKRVEGWGARPQPTIHETREKFHDTFYSTQKPRSKTPKLSRNAKLKTKLVRYYSPNVP